MPQATARREATVRRRADILEAALRCFDEQGVVATTMEDVRAAAEVSVGSLYHHFPNKEAIAAALYVSLIDEYQRSAESALARTRSPRARVRAAIEHHVRWSLRNRRKTSFLLSHREPDVRRLSDPHVAEMNRAVEARLQEWLDGEIRAGRLRRMSADVFVSIVVGSAQSFVRRWIAGSATTSPEDAVDALSEAAWRAVRADPKPGGSRKRPRPRS